MRLRLWLRSRLLSLNFFAYPYRWRHNEQVFWWNAAIIAKAAVILEVLVVLQQRFIQAGVWDAEADDSGSISLLGYILSCFRKGTGKFRRGRQIDDTVFADTPAFAAAGDEALLADALVVGQVCSVV